MTRCWCGTRNAYFSPVGGSCGGTGTLDCICGGDFCICHNHGEVECGGCPDCETAEDIDEPCGHPCEDYFAQHGECDCTIYGSYSAGQRARRGTEITLESLPPDGTV